MVETQKLERPARPKMPDTCRIKVPLTAEQIAKLVGKNTIASIVISDDKKNGAVVVADINHPDYKKHQAEMEVYYEAKNKYKLARAALRDERAKKRGERVAAAAARKVAKEKRAVELAEMQKTRVENAKKRIDIREKKLAQQIKALEESKKKIK